jgi:hypothetical protein
LRVASGKVVEVNPLAVRRIADGEFPPDLPTIFTGETIGIEGIGIG